MVVILSTQVYGHSGMLPASGHLTRLVEVPMISIYVHPTCSSCRKAIALLEESGAEVERRDYFRDRFTAGELAAVLARAGRTPSEMLSNRARAYKDLNIAKQQLSDDELLQAMVDEPTLLRRPLAINGNTSTVGFNADALAALVKADRTA